MSAGLKQKTTEEKSFAEQLGEQSLDILMGIETRQASQVGKIDEELDKMEAGIQDAMSQKDARLKEVKMRIIKASAEKLNEGVAQEERDLALAMTGLNELMARIGVDYSELEKPSETEKAKVANAEKAVKEAEFGLMQAQKSWVFRARRIADAKDKIQEAQKELADAKVESLKSARKRLMNASIEGSLKRFGVQVEKVVDIMSARYKDTLVQIGKVGKRLESTLQTKQEAAEKVKILDQQITNKEQEVLNAEQELASLTNGTPEYVAKEREVAKLRNEAEILRGDRNTAFAVLGSKDAFSSELKTHQIAQQKLATNHRIFVAVLKSDTQDRLVTFESRLEAMKNIADQQVAEQLNVIGTEIDCRNAERMAEMAAVSDKIREDMLKAQPERIRRLLNVLDAQAEQITHMRQIEKEAIEEYKRRYGMNLTAGSLFGRVESE